jgi:lipopolysaccharide exporter
MIKLPFLKSEFSKNVFKLISGTAIAHIASFLLMPILTRLYGKADLGYWQLYVSTITTLGVVASFKYETAIVLPKEEKEADAITMLSLLATFFFTFVVTVLLMLRGSSFLKMLNAEVLSPFLLFISLGVFLFGLLQILQSILIRKKLFGVLAVNKIIQLGSSQLLAVLLGIFLPTFKTLLFTQIIGYALAALVLFKLSRISLRITFKELAVPFKKYKKFPTVNTGTIFLNTLSLQLPIFMLSRFFGSEQVALYSMANQMMSVPLFMIGSSVHQVYYQRATEAAHQSKEQLMAVYKSTVKKLSLFAVFPVLIFLLFGPQIAKLYFGPSYTETGVYMQIITFWMYFQFVNSPISATFNIIDRQEVGFILVGISIVLRFFVMYLFRGNARLMILALSLSAGLFYLFYNLSIYFYIKKIKDVDYVS